MGELRDQLLDTLTTGNRLRAVPRTITRAISACVDPEPGNVRVAIDNLKNEYKKQSKSWSRPISVDYSDEATADAYTVCYLPRNTLIPKIALLACAHHPTLLAGLPSELRILDLGSGPGSVVLGLLDLFQSNTMSRVELDITALDTIPTFLAKQLALVQHMLRPGWSHRCRHVDLTEPEDYGPVLAEFGPYDLVFAANVLAELPETALDKLLGEVTQHLSDVAIVVNYESDSNFAKTVRPRLAGSVARLGLHVYYPCPPDQKCEERSCWKAREDAVECPEIVVGDESLETGSTQRSYLTVLSRQDASVYNILRSHNSGLVWGAQALHPPKTVAGGFEYQCDLCTERGQDPRRIRTGSFVEWLGGEPINRNDLVGLSKDLTGIRECWDIADGFRTSNVTLLS